MTEQRPLKLHEALAYVQAKVDNVAREASGQAGGAKFKYATLDSILNMLRPIMAEVGLSVLQYVEDNALITVISDSFGTSITCGSYALGEFIGDQKRGASISYARRYQLAAIFFIAQEDDPDKSNKVWATKKARLNFETVLLNRVDTASSVSELTSIYNANKVKITEMQQSPDGDDQVCAQFILSRFSEQKELITALEQIKQVDEANKPIGGY